MKELLAPQKSKAIVIGLLALLLAGGGAASFIATREDGSQTSERKTPNRLIHEKSPYLLQHAHNPVDWYPWGKEAFEKARKENRLIFLSIGYSTCYWCHVMERRVFENEGIAALMNQYFVNIKVDREERPDIDRIYMAALQTMTGGGGWPMSMFLTPDLKPFYGATFVPPEQFRKLLEKMRQVWTTEPEKLRRMSQQLTDMLRRQIAVEGAQTELDKSILKKGFEEFRQIYDAQHGGFGDRPKFPRAVVFNFLFRYYARFSEQDALEMSLATLRRMAGGGMYDHLGGGFHRYSTDAQWRVPHFEKMLYDQAQLACSYLDAFQITKEKFYASIARATLGYVLRDMTDREGGFYSAEDAESAVGPAKPNERAEGAFYAWRKEEIDRILGTDRSEIFNYVYGVEATGNALEDPQGVFAGRNILYRARTEVEAAKKFNKPPEEILRLLEESREKLFVERERRPRPHRDDKILVSWNGLMISAMARAAQVLDEPSYMHSAERSAEFIFSKLYQPQTKQLLRRYRAGEARHEATLEDYAFFTRGLIDLYEASLNIHWLRQAIELTGGQNAVFYDDRSGGFFDTSGKDETLLLRTREDYDGAEPAGNSIAIWNLLRLSQMTDNRKWRAMTDRALATFGERLTATPQTLPQMLAALDFHLDKPKQIIIAGVLHREDTEKMLREVHKWYIPNKVILLADGSDGQEFLGRYIPFLQSVRMMENRATAYICENYACKLPTSDLLVLKRLLGEKDDPVRRP